MFLKRKEHKERRKGPQRQHVEIIIFVVLCDTTLRFSAVKYFILRQPHNFLISQQRMILPINSQFPYAPAYFDTFAHYGKSFRYQKNKLVSRLVSGFPGISRKFKIFVDFLGTDRLIKEIGNNEINQPLRLMI